MTAKESPWFSADGLAEYLDIKVGTVYHWRHRNEGPPSVKIGAKLRYRRTDVEAWLAARTKAGAA